MVAPSELSDDVKLLSKDVPASDSSDSSVLFGSPASDVEMPDVDNSVKKDASSESSKNTASTSVAADKGARAPELVKLKIFMQKKKKVVEGLRKSSKGGKDKLGPSDNNDESLESEKEPPLPVRTKLGDCYPVEYFDHPKRASPRDAVSWKITKEESLVASVTKLTNSSNFYSWLREFKSVLKRNKLSHLLEKEGTRLEQAECFEYLTFTIGVQLKPLISEFRPLSTNLNILKLIVIPNFQKDTIELVKAERNLKLDNSSTLRSVSEAIATYERIYDGIYTKPPDPTMLMTKLASQCTGKYFTIASKISKPGFRSFEELFRLVRLLDDEELDKPKPHVVSAYNSRVTKPSKIGKKAAKQKKSRTACWQCGQEGHRRHECPKRNTESGGNRRALMVRVDSATDSSAINNKSFFHYLRIVSDVTIQGITGKSLKATHEGFITLEGGYKLRAYYVPDIPCNLVSEQDLIHTYDMTKNKNGIFTKEGNLLPGFWQDGFRLYTSLVLPKETERIVDALAVNTRNELDNELEVHRRLGHVSKNVLKLCQGNNTLLNLPKITVSSSGCCDDCRLGKIRRNDTIQKACNARSVAEIIHSDVMGPFKVESVHKDRFLVTFVDEYSRYTDVYPIRSKLEVFEKFKVFKAFAETQTGKSVKTLFSDNGGEYTLAEFLQYLQDNGIVHHFSLAGLPRTNGLAERINLTLGNIVRTTVSNSKISLRYWPYLFRYATFMKNKLTHSALTRRKIHLSPEEVFLGRKPDYRHCHTFGALCYVLDNNEKLLPRGIKALYLGREHNGIRSMVLAENKIFLTRNIIFEDSMMYKDAPSVEKLELNSNAKILDLYDSDEIARSNQQFMGETPMAVTNDDSDVEFLESVDTEESSTTPDPKTAYIAKSDAVPAHVYEAIKTPEWRAAVEKEIQSHVTKKSLELVDGTGVSKSKVLPVIWVFTRKLNGTCKARMCLRGDLQKEDMYDETGTSLLSVNSLRVLMMLISNLKFEASTYDIDTAFLNADIDTEVYIRPQPLFPETKKVGNPLLRLRKAIYGLKQSPVLWEKHFTEGLLSLGYRWDKDVAGIYVKDSVMVGVFVDDIIISAPTKQKIEDEASKINKLYQLKKSSSDLLIGYKFKKTREGVLMYNDDKIKELAESYKINKNENIRLPIFPNFYVKEADLAESDLVDFDLRKVIGLLIFISNYRPDIVYAVNYLAQFGTTKKLIIWKRIIHIIQYLLNTIGNGVLIFNQSDRFIEWGKSLADLRKHEITVDVFSDSDHASCPITRYTQHGMVVKIGQTVIMYKSKKIKIVAKSSYESELAGFYNAIEKEADFLYTLLLFFGKVKIKYWLDNESVIHKILTKNRIFGKKSSDIKILKLNDLFVRKVSDYASEVESRISRELNHVKGTDNPADLFTKPVTHGVHRALKDKIIYDGNVLELG